MKTFTQIVSVNEVYLFGGKWDLSILQVAMLELKINLSGGSSPFMS